jgi:hypothetical protein
MKTPEEIAKTEFNFNPYKAADKIFDALGTHGVSFPPNPGYIKEEDKQFPLSFDDLTPYEIMNKIAIFTSLFAYTNVLEATAKSEVTSWERSLELNEAKEYILAENTQVTTKKALRDVADSVVATKEKLTMAEARYSILKAMREGYERYIFALSRYVTVAQNEANL